MLNRLNLILALAFAGLLVLLMLARVNHSRPNYQIHLGDDMTYSPAYTSYEANSNFANGRTMQPPAPGTIARSAQLLHFEATPQDAVRAGEQLANPFDWSSEAGRASTERGQAIFQVYCTACHGADGAGSGPVTQRGFPPPPSLLTGKSLEMKDGQLLHILTFGQNSMPDFAAQLPPDRRWDVINHIRSLQESATPPPDANLELKVDAQPSPAESHEPELPRETDPIGQQDPAAPIEADTESKL